MASTRVVHPSTEAPSTERAQHEVVTTAAGRRALAVLRIATGFVFLWAFLDKTFGLRHSTGAPRPDGSVAPSWLDGGEPSQGYLQNGAVGPAKEIFAAMASPATDWLFMLGMLGVGAAVVLGIGLRLAACAGSLLMMTLWVAQWPPQDGSMNPVVDQHLVYTLVLVVCALLLAGDTWGLGRRWAALRLVRRAPLLR
ncbi:DoxX family protein [Cellulomonas cellasea]|uniref:DoxX family protein n=1 Tax=Cellulomonas cellasea TaxID=43670 RepID=UPI0025A3D5EC|nr:DoxX family protein [Cellulomonas cellasea]MDM8083986.1 DoxX family protein [Cellulomonas cellasea]